MKFNPVSVFYCCIVYWFLIFSFVLVEELITLTENVAGALALGQNNAESMTILLANLRVHGPQLEAVSKDTLDRAFVTFRNASQDERLTIIARMNLLELIELRAKSWQISDGLNTYYQHKATNVGAADFCKHSEIIYIFLNFI